MGTGSFSGEGRPKVTGACCWPLSPI
jgi:hypothetical protein